MADLTVRASLRRLHSPDAWDLKTFQPDDPLDFCILVQAMLGPVDGPGEDSFNFVLCTPQWIARELERDDIVWGRARLIVSHYSYQALETTVLTLCQRTEADQVRHDHGFEEVGAKNPLLIAGTLDVLWRGGIRSPLLEQACRGILTYAANETSS